MATFVEANRNQPYLLPPDLRDWIPEDDITHFIIQAVDQVDLSLFHLNHRGSGSPQYHPRLMLALLIYCYANGIFSSRKIERATYRDLGARFIAANTHPDHDTICRFRRENEQAFTEAFLQVLKMAQELRLLRVGTVSVDGTKIPANASINKSIRFDRATALEAQLRSEIQQLLEEAKKADHSKLEDPDKLPKELAFREKLREKLAAAKAKIKEEARARAKREQKDFEKKLQARERRKGRRKGKKPKPPDPTPKASDQSNMTDPDSRLMRKNQRSEYRQCYNPQATVDAEGSMLVLGARVSNNASDSNELVSNLASIPEELGKPETVLADTGYKNGKEVEALQRKGIKVLVATGAPSRRKYDFRPERPKKKKLQVRKAWIRRMQKEMGKEENKELYRLRKQTVEPVFGILKEILGFRRFLLRGLKKVELEWKLVTLAYNCKRFHRLAWGL